MSSSQKASSGASQQFLLIEPESVEADTQEKLIDPEDLDTGTKKGDGLVSMRPQ